MIEGQTIIESGVDYITATSGSKAGFNAFTEIGEQCLLEERRAGNIINQKNIEGFSGYQSGSVFAGAFNGMMMLVLSSGIAKENYIDVVRHAKNISRLDVQVTVAMNPPEPNLAEKAEAKALRYKSVRGGKREIELRRNDARGKTLYFGRRVSDRFGRLYDKGRESGLDYYADAWRLELQLRRRYAKQTAMALLNDEARESNLEAVVLNYFAGCGVTRKGANLPRMYCCTRIQGDSDANRMRRWLHSQVRPTVARLIELGQAQEAIESLGLSDLVTLNSPKRRKVR